MSGGGSNVVPHSRLSVRTGGSSIREIDISVTEVEAENRRRATDRERAHTHTHTHTRGACDCRRASRTGYVKKGSQLVN